MKISAVVIAKDEEKNIADCIKCLAFCGEIIVIDDFSSDKTAGIAKNLGAKVYKRHLAGNFAAQKNFGFQKTSGDWVVFLDADEYITDKLRREIVTTLKNAPDYVNGFKLRRVDIFFGKRLKHAEVGKAWVTRIIRREIGHWERKVHERLVVEGRCGKLKNELLHKKSDSLARIVKSINMYSDLHARALYEEGKKSSVFKIIVWPIGKFIDNFFIKLGMLDGSYGALFALLMSFHSFLSWSKLWIRQKRLA